MTYLDWAASAPPQPPVADDFQLGNPSSAHACGQRQRCALDAAIAAIGAACGWPAEQIVATGGATEADHLVLYSPLAYLRDSRAAFRRGIVHSAVEHAAVAEPARQLARMGFPVRVAPVGADGLLDLDRFAACLDEATRLVAIVAVNNETGAIQPLAPAAEIVRAHARRIGRRIHFHTDAVQALCRGLEAPIAAADSAAASAHKLGGPVGVGALWLRGDAALELLPRGGGQQDGRRPGTENVAGLRAFARQRDSLGRGRGRPSAPRRAAVRAVDRRRPAPAPAGGAAAPGRAARALLALHRLPGGARRAGRGAGADPQRRGDLRVARIGVRVERAQDLAGTASHGRAGGGSRRCVPGVDRLDHHRRRHRPPARRSCASAAGAADARAVTEFLVKYGEISLKGANRLAFEKRLMRNITRRLPRAGASVRRTWGRIFLTVEDALAGDAARILAATFGVVSYAHVARFEKTPESFPPAADFVASELAADPGQGSFKVEASREDKQFGLDSYAIACLLGDLLRARLPDFRVDVRRPDATVRVEVRDHIYVYAGQHRGPGGLPVGCSGRGLLLLSGGIDSPVAGYLMGGRGLAVDAVYFHAYPFTSAEAEQKVQRLAAALRRFLPNLALHVVPFTALQVRIKEAARAAEITLLSRCAMMSIASMLAEQHGHECLITGESLAQVASQTVPSLHLTGSYATLPVLRPLIGHGKETIIKIAQEIGTFAISTLPYPDCCTLFAPRHPVINPVMAELRYSFERLDLGDLLEQSVAGTQTPALNEV